MSSFQKQSIIWGWVVFALSLLTYMLSLEPSASLWDCSEFIATSYKMEVGHPPGAPLFMMINRIFTIFSPDTAHVAMFVNTASAVASALTIAFLFWTIAHLGRRLIRPSDRNYTPTFVETAIVMAAAFIGSMAYAFTDTFWFSAIEGEVYAQSSLFTALVFWTILKWENVADQPHADRWLVLLAYLMGLSIGVHLLNLLAIPAIVLVYYYRTHDVRSRAGWWKALGVSVVILGAVLYVIIPGTVRLGAFIDRIFVNGLGLPVNSGLAFSLIAIVSLLGYGAYRAQMKGRRVLNIALLCVGVIVIGYSTYASVVIRSVENPPMNSNSPDDPYQLLSFLNREQYGNRPLFKGQYYSAPVIDVIKKKSYYYDDDQKRYIPYEYTADYVYDPRFTTIFPRMYESSQAEEYERWAGIDPRKARKIKTSDGKTEIVPSFGDNLRYFFGYQLNYMYWRYFLWNFVGRQNDLQAQGEITAGNWLSGIKFIDELYLGPQDNLPANLADNKGRNTYYFLPLILGLIGLFWQLSRDRNNFTVVFWLFFMTGIAIILYLNQPPMQPRERDYAFAGSFYAFSIWIGLGVIGVWNMLGRIVSDRRVAAGVATAACLTVPVILLAQNWDDHTRAGRYVARDFGADYLNSTLPGSIILPYGDNDTFPLWYNQEVEGVRTDVKVANLSYLQSDWYARQMTDKSNDAEPIAFTLPKSKWYRANEYIPIVELFDDYITADELFEFIKNDSQIKKRIASQFSSGNVTDFIPGRKIAIPVNKENALRSGIVAPRDSSLMVDTVYLTLNGRGLTRSEYLILDMISTADWSRPIYFTQPSSVDALGGLKDYLQIDGFAYRLVPIKTKGYTLNMGRIDTDYLYDKLMNEFRYGNLKGDIYVDDFIDHTVNSTQVRTTFARLAKKLAAEGDTLRAIKALDKVMEEVPYPNVGYSYTTPDLIEAFYATGQTERGDELFNGFKDNILDNLEYFAQFSGKRYSSVTSQIQQYAYYLQMLEEIAARAGRTELEAEVGSYLDALFGAPGK